MIEIYVYYYIDKNGNVKLELKRVITDKETIKRILRDLLQKGYSEAIIVTKTRLAKIKIENLIKLLSK